MVDGLAVILDEHRTVPELLQGTILAHTMLLTDSILSLYPSLGVDHSSMRYQTLRDIEELKVENGWNEELEQVYTVGSFIMSSRGTIGMLGGGAVGKLLNILASI